MCCGSGIVFQISTQIMAKQACFPSLVINPVTTINEFAGCEGLPEPEKGDVCEGYASCFPAILVSPEIDAMISAWAASDLAANRKLIQHGIYENSEAVRIEDCNFEPVRRMPQRVIPTTPSKFQRKSKVCSADGALKDGFFDVAIK